LPVRTRVDSIHSSAPDKAAIPADVHIPDSSRSVLDALRELKTARSRLSLRCPPVVVEALRERRKLHDEERAAAEARWSSDWEAEGLVFTTANGRPVDASKLRRYFRQACKTAGMGWWAPYEIRHSAASLLSAAGVPLENVADVLGHNGTRMAGLVYRHVLAPTIEAGTAPMQAMLGEPDGSIGSPIGSPFGSPAPERCPRCAGAAIRRRCARTPHRG
jgi:integrase